jgi:hypothetical protein
VANIAQHAIQFLPVWGNLPDHLRDPLGEIWRVHGGLSEEELAGRYAQVVLLAMAGEKVAGIATVNKIYLQQLENYFYAFRCLVVPDFRAPGLDTALVIKTKEFLETRYESDTDKQAKGLVMVIQNEFIKAHWRQAIWKGADMIYIGETPRGEHVRISYFKNATIA